MSRMSGILISRYFLLLVLISFVTYCFQLDKIIYIFRTASLILMDSSAKQSSLIALQNEFKNKNLIVPDIRLMSLDRITNLTNRQVVLTGLIIKHSIFTNTIFVGKE